MDLADLKPYFQGTTMRTGAPSWLGNSSPYKPKVSRVSGCMASSMRSPSEYGQFKLISRKPGITLESSSERNCTYFALGRGSAQLISSESEYPAHGITMLQA